MFAWFKLLIFLVGLIAYTQAQRHNNNFESNNQVGGQRGNGLSQGFNQQNQHQQGGQPTIEQLKQSFNELQDVLQHEKDGTRFGLGGGFMSAMTSAGRGFCSLLYAFNGRGPGYGGMGGFGGGGFGGGGFGGGFGGGNWDRSGSGHQGGVSSGGTRPGNGEGSNGYGQGSNGHGQGSNGHGHGSNGYGEGSNGYGQGSNGYDGHGSDRREGSDNNNRRQQEHGQSNQSSNGNTKYGYNDHGQRG